LTEKSPRHKVIEVYLNNDDLKCFTYIIFMPSPTESLPREHIHRHI